jgi:hypothetical protein
LSVFRTQAGGVGRENRRILRLVAACSDGIQGAKVYYWWFRNPYFPYAV